MIMKFRYRNQGDRVHFCCQRVQRQVDGKGTSLPRRKDCFTAENPWASPIQLGTRHDRASNGAKNNEGMSICFARVRRSSRIVAVQTQSKLGK